MKHAPLSRATALVRLGQLAALAGCVQVAPLSWGAPPSGAARKEERTVTARDREHWAFAPLNQVTVQAPGEAGCAGANPIDSFWTLRAAAGLAEPASKAEPEVLLRRLSFGAVGLPPTPAASDSFAQHPTTAAYEQWVDHFLASPRFGERWARRWLDVARYADSNGYEDDDDRKFAWPYRDWVIRALNSDLPYDLFVKWQLAGDEYAPENPDAVTATGFISAALCDRIPPTDTEENKLLYRYNELDDIVSTTASGFLALTVGCARCHDHKFDPIPTRDYYRLVAAFTTGRRTEASLSKPVREFAAWRARQRRAYREESMAWLALPEREVIRLRHSEHDFVFDAGDLKKKYGRAVEPRDEQVLAWLKPEDQGIWHRLAEAAAAAAQQPEAAATALLYTDTQGRPAPEYLLGRGNVRDRQQPVSLGFLQVLSRGRSAEDYWAAAKGSAGEGEPAGSLVNQAGFLHPPTTYQRKALAEWIADPEHGAGLLLARVIVNRLWQGYFGEGLVRTASDFGTQGTLPTHPLLLDWLAAELIRQGWHLKPLHRLILTSQVFRARSGTRLEPAPFEAAARNQAAGTHGEETAPLRRRPLRMEAEVLRDAMLSVGGKMSFRMFGPPFRPIIPKEAIATRSRSPYPTDLKDSTETSRRSIYAFVKRSVRYPMLEVFDSPDPSSACGARNETTVPTQALTLLNDAFVRQCAREFARRVLAEAGPEPRAQIDRAFLLALGRHATSEETSQAGAFLAETGRGQGDGQAESALTDLCHTLFTLNEFIYVD